MFEDVKIDDVTCMTGITSIDLNNYATLTVPYRQLNIKLMRQDFNLLSTK